MVAYFFHGQGSDERVFKNIELPENFYKVFVDYPVPERKETLPEYAGRISEQIDTNTSFILIGMSLGGMICTEIADQVKPEQIFIISSAKQRSELPFRYRFQKTIPLFKLVPKRMIKWGALLLQPLVEPDRNKEKETFKSMLKMKDPVYLKRTIYMIVNWKRTDCSEKIIHIHGNKDHTIPIRNIKKPILIEGGSHMMTLTRGVEVSELIKSFLAQ